VLRARIEQKPCAGFDHRSQSQSGKQPSVTIDVAGRIVAIRIQQPMVERQRHAAIADFASNPSAAIGS